MICDLNRSDPGPGAEIDISLDLYTPSGFHFEATADRTNMGGITMKGVVMHGAKTGILVS